MKKKKLYHSRKLQVHYSRDIQASSLRTEGKVYKTNLVYHDEIHHEI